MTGERLALCGLSDNTTTAPGGGKVKLLVDPGSGPRGCAAYWPTQPGPHRIVQVAGRETKEFPFLVLPSASFKALQARELGEATVRWAAEQNAPAIRAAVDRSGPAWP